MIGLIFVFLLAILIISIRIDKKSHYGKSIYDDVCPHCGAIGCDFKELAKEYKDLVVMYMEKKNETNPKI